MDALDEVERIAVTANFVRSLATFLSALDRGDATLAVAAIRSFAEGSEAAAIIRHVPLWWACTLARHLTDGLWGNSLHVRIPLEIDGPPATRWRSLRRRYIDVLRGRGTAEVDLWPSQWEAASRCVDPADDLVVALPTSAGKTRVAELCILRTLADERRVIYVTPLRALSAQLERTLSRTFRPLGHSVTALYGASGVAAADVATLRDADIVVATPEKLDFALRVDPSVLDNVGLVVLDEGHMIGLGTREIRYEVLVQRLLRRPTPPPGGSFASRPSSARLAPAVTNGRVATEPPPATRTMTNRRAVEETGTVCPPRPPPTGRSAGRSRISRRDPRRCPRRRDHVVVAADPPANRRAALERDGGTTRWQWTRRSHTSRGSCARSPRWVSDATASRRTTRSSCWRPPRPSSRTSTAC